MPPFMPAWPVHSIVETDVVYLYLADFKFTATRSTEHYMVSINVQRREVLSTFKLPSAVCTPPPRFFPSNFSCYFNKRTQWNQLLREKCENELTEKWEKEVTGELASFGWS